MKKILFKRALLSLSITCMAGNMFAQTTLTAATSNVQAGETFVSVYQDTGYYISPGNSGANVTWDFSAVPFNIEPPFSDRDTITFVDCSSTPACGYFSGSNLAIVTISNEYSNSGPNGSEVISGIDTQYEYITANQSVASFNGYIGFYDNFSNVQNPIFTDTDVLSTGSIELQYPFSYTNSFTNSYAEHDINDSEYFYGTQTITYDGYGTLITPAGTFQNAVRVHSVQNIIDSEISGGTAYLTRYIYDDYNWYVAGFHSSLFNLNTSYDSFYDDTFVDTNYNGANYTIQLATAVPAVNNTATTFELFPNPAKEALNIKFSVPARQAVSVTILDMLGKEVGAIGGDMYDQGEHQLSYNTSALPKGMYIVHLQSNAGSVTRKVEVM